MTIDSMNKAAVKAISLEAQEVLTTFAESHGLTVEYRKGAFDPATGYCDLTYRFALAGTDIGKAEWVRRCHLYGLKPDDYGRQFDVLDKTYTLTGFRPRAPKRPITATGPDGRSYMFTEAGIAKALALQIRHGS